MVGGATFDSSAAPEEAQDYPMHDGESKIGCTAESNEYPGKLSKVKFLEFFAGSANLTVAVAELGIEVHPPTISP